jgi:hypothetical protein
MLDFNGFLKYKKSNMNAITGKAIAVGFEVTANNKKMY